MKAEIETKVLNCYQLDKFSADKIASLMNINRKTVYRILRKHGVKSRTLSQAAMKYTCNNFFFSVIDTEEKAYWLGALYADGNVSKKASRSGQIFLTSTDKEWVEKFMSDINSTNKPRLEKHSKFKSIIWKAQITSSQMYTDLVTLGCIPVKSHVIRIPDINKKLVHHFIRGYFDGDGTVGIYKNIKGCEWKILKSGLCSGSEEFLVDILKILPTKNKSMTYRGVFVVQFSLRDSIALYNYMYKESTVHLQRKKAKFDTYLQDYVPRKRFNDYNRSSE